jgi:hypothetical protein
MDTRHLGRGPLPHARRASAVRPRTGSFEI